MKPKKIICQKKKDSIKIIFDNNEEYIISAELLRVESPSAEVQGHGYNQKQIIKGKQNVLINDIKPVGNYAIRIIFNFSDRITISLSRRIIIFKNSIFKIPST